MTARWLVPVGLGVVAMLLRGSLDPWLGDRLIFVFAFPSVMFAAWLGGLRQGLTTGLVCTAWSLAPALAPTLTGSPLLQALSALSFAVAAGVIAWLTGRLRPSPAEALDRAAAVGLHNPAPRGDRSDRIVGVTNVALDVGDPLATAKLLNRTAEHFLIAQSLAVDGFTVLRAVRRGGKIVDFEWEYLNPAAERLFGRRSSELVGRRLLETMPAARHHPALFPRYRRAVETGSADVAEFEYDQDGLQGHFRNVAVKLGDGLAITFEDIGDRKRAEGERLELLEHAQAARRQAEEANRVKDEFLLTLSHELRTPLNAIVGWARLLAMRNHATDLEPGIEVIQRNAQLQAKLIDDLLDVSRILSGRLSVERQPTGLERVVAAAVEAVRPAADQKEIVLEVALGQPERTVLADPSRLQQIFWNVLVNSVKFTPRGGTVHITTRLESGQVVATVTDTGEGVDPAFRPFVFDRFRQADGSLSRRHGGLGIGLALAKHLTDLHDGTIGLDSPGPGLGTTVEVRLPLAAHLNGATPQDRSGGPDPARSTDALRDLRLLLVEDDGDSRVGLCEILRDHGACCEAVGSGREALALLETTAFDCLIFDLGLPDVDGYRLLQQARVTLEHRPAPMPPAIALTAFARATDRQRAIEIGFDEFIEKPADPERVINVAQRLCKRPRNLIEQTTPIVARAGSAANSAIQ